MNRAYSPLKIHTSNRIKYKMIISLYYTDGYAEGAEGAKERGNNMKFRSFRSFRVPIIV